MTPNFLCSGINVSWLLPNDIATTSRKTSVRLCLIYWLVERTRKSDLRFGGNYSKVEDEELWCKKGEAMEAMTRWLWIRFNEINLCESPENKLSHKMIKGRAFAQSVSHCAWCYLRLNHPKRNRYDQCSLYVRQTKPHLPIFPLIPSHPIWKK